MVSMNLEEKPSEKILRVDLLNFTESSKQYKRFLDFFSLSLPLAKPELMEIFMTRGKRCKIFKMCLAILEHYDSQVKRCQTRCIN